MPLCVRDDCGCLSEWGKKTGKSISQILFFFFETEGMKLFSLFCVLFAQVGFISLLTYSIPVTKPLDLIQIFNTSRSFVDDEIELLADLDFSGETLSAPLGTISNVNCVTFSGVLHGHGHAIKGLVMDNTGEGVFKHAGLFCCLGNAKIENLMIDTSCFFAGEFSGALSVNVTGPLSLTNVTNKANVTGALGAGMVSHVEKFRPHGIIVFENCVNEGNITGNDKVGGFVGLVFYNEYTEIHFINSTNRGIITAFYQGQSGGFIGSACRNNEIQVVITNCTHNGTVNGIKYSGGYIGELYATHTINIRISNSTNKGVVNGTECVGGFIGWMVDYDMANVSIERCTNDGVTNGTNYIGGFIGWIEEGNDGTIQVVDCTNTGHTSGFNSVSGFFGGVYRRKHGDLTSHFIDCQNNGTFSSEGTTGGFVGTVSSQGTMTFTHCSSLMSIYLSCQNCSFGSFIGLFFQAYDAIGTEYLLISSSRTDGIIKATCSDCSIGGVIGRVDGTINATIDIINMKTFGTIEMNSNDTKPSRVGGMIGSVTDNSGFSLIIRNGTNDLTIISRDAKTVGGFIGTFTNNKNVIENAALVLTNNKNTGDVTCESCLSAGGFIGTLFNIDSVTIEECVNHGNLNVNGTNNDAGGFVGSFSNGMNIIKTSSLLIQNNTNNGVVTVNSNAKTSAGGFAGSFYESVGVDLNIIHCINTASVHVTSSNNDCTIGGFVGRVSDNGNITVNMRGCLNNAQVVSSTETNNGAGGLLGVFNENSKSGFNAFECSNDGTINVSGGTNNAGGLIGSVSANPLSSLNILKAINRGEVKVNTCATQSSIGGVIGNMERNPSTSMVIDGALNAGNLLSYTTCKSVSSGLVGWINPHDQRSAFSLTISNCANTGNVSNSKNACGLFFVSKEPSRTVIATVTNSINKGEIEGQESYGIGSQAAYASNVISMGRLN